MKTMSATIMILSAMVCFPLFALQCEWCHHPMLEDYLCCRNCGKERGTRPPERETPREVYPVQQKREGCDTFFKIGFFEAVSLPSISNANVYGLDVEFGAVGNTLYGLGLGWFGGFREVCGMQCSALGNINNGDSGVWGIQIAGMLNQSDKVYGIQVASIINGAMQEMYGVQVAALGNGAGCMRGLQVGFYNGDKAVDMCGIQIGVINTAKRMNGVQIGAFNFIDGSPISFSPVINMYF